MAKGSDPRKLKDEAAEAVQKGKWRRALDLYHELETLEPKEGVWPQRAGDMYRRLSQPAEAVATLTRAADVYSRSGFLLKAIAVCKLILEIDPGRTEVQERLAQYHAARGIPAGGAGATQAARTPTSPGAAPAPPRPSRPSGETAAVAPPAESKVDLPFADTIDVDTADAQASSRARTATQPAFPPPALSASTPPPPPPPPLPPKVARAIALADIPLARTVPGARESQELTPLGDVPVYEIPLGDDDLVEDDIPIYEGSPAQTARTVFPRTPLFSALDEDRLLVLIEHVTLHQLAAGEVLFRRGDRADALYVVADGEVAVLAPDERGAEVEVARLGERAFFGEIGLVADLPRVATIQATCDTELLGIGRAAIGRLLEDAPDILQILLRFLRDRLVGTLVETNPLFMPFPPQERRELAARFTFLEADRDAVLLEQGKRSPGLFVILAGRADVMRDGGKVAELESGDLFGEMSLLTRKPAIATIRATTKSYLLELVGAKFQELIMTHPQILEYVNQIADQRKELLDAYREGHVRVV